MATESEKPGAKLKELNVKRSSIKGQITKFKNYLGTLETLNVELSSIELAELSLKLSRFEGIFTKFDSLQSEIEVLNSNCLDDEIDERDSIEHDIVFCIATAKKTIEDANIQNETRRRPLSPESPCHHKQHTHTVGFKLPQIQISKFDGACFRWLEFRDTFQSLIHTNERISDIHKFHYLVSYLEGDAARIISNLEVSSLNYNAAWSLLCKRYDNKRLLINYHISALLNVQQITRESERSLRFLVDHVTKNLRALSSLGQPTDKWDILLIFMLSAKLDSHSLRKWEELRNSFDDVPTLDQFHKFLTDRADVLETLNRSKYDNSSKTQPVNYRPNSNTHSTQQTSIHSRPYNSNIPNSSFTNKQERIPYVKTFASTNHYTQRKFACLICNDQHKIYQCPTFRNKNYNEKIADVNKHNLCVNCLRQGHSLSECRLGPCMVCNKAHNTILHQDAAASHPQPANSVVTFSKQYANAVVLSTAILEVSNPFTNKTEKVRALLDCGSQSSFITQDLKHKIQLDTHKIDAINIIGIGNKSCNKIVESCNIQLKSLNSPYTTTLSCLVMDELTGDLPKAPLNIQHLKLPDNIKLADPNFDLPAKIDILLGADIFWDVLGSDQYSLGPKNLKLINSKFGWLVAGPYHASSSKHVHCNHSTNNAHNNPLNNSSEFLKKNDFKNTLNQSLNNPLFKNEDTHSNNHASDNPLNNVGSAEYDPLHKIENILTKFWEVEELPQRAILSKEEKLCENYFLSTTTRLSTGRFCVRLPFVQSPNCLGESYDMAKRRLLNLEKRFRRNTSLKTQYTEFIREYAELGHLSESTVNFKPNPSYFLCHHAVFREGSESTKIRVVFDGSAPTSSGYSLNNILRVGPNVQESLFSILIRARQYKYLLIGDIEKMYRQVEVHPSDRNMQLILWRNDESEPIRTLRLNVLTYGTASAAYLSTRCLWQVGEECKNEQIKDIIQNDFYVDDLITGSNDEEELRYIQKQVADTLNSACFPLRKYKSNIPNLLESIEQNPSDKLILSESSSTLGLGWNPSKDYLHFPTKHVTTENSSITKRSIMSNSFKIFDPLGLLSPCIIKPKMILQKLWLLKIDWDEPVPRDIQESWEEFSENVHHLTGLQIPRTVLCDQPSNIEFHTFSDASQLAYGACIYVKSKNIDNEVTIKLLCAKSKVSPLKPMTIPRLELCAALLAARLTKSITEAIKYKPTRIIHWCDSSVVLAWIHSIPRNLKTFVANRVGEIVETTSLSSWRYVPTADNPADLISRGINPSLLQESNLWWHGPIFLAKEEGDWPILKINNSKEDLPEVKTILSNPVALGNAEIKFENYSRFSKLQRVFAYVKRFIFNLKNPLKKRKGNLNTEELKETFRHLCSIAQSQSFAKELQMLKQNLPLHNNSNMLSLSPFLDENDLIRVGGRIDASNYPYAKKHPIILDSSHHLTKLFFEREHLRQMHAGPQLLLATVRESIWPINGRRLARNTVHNCVKCRRFQGKTLCPKMGNLPAQRITPDYPFLSVGLDFAGPFFITNRKGRGAQIIKCYLCLFVCMRYKCVHLEAVSGLSKDEFVMTLRRFISRRGKPAEIFSDNGRNFVAAAKELGSFLKTHNHFFSDFAAQEGIKFSFIPAYSPHFGGLWESGIKSAKYHIKRVIGNTHLTFEELQTLFAQVEAILNSRPLCPLSSNPNDLLSLSPGHFLIGRPLTTFPSPALEDVNPNKLQRYQRLEQIRQHFWLRWQKEYISELQQRQKWTKHTANLDVGDLVLIKEDNVAPLCWNLGRVTKLYSGPDQITRVADLKTSKGCIRRSLVRLSPLPKPEDL